MWPQILMVIIISLGSYKYFDNVVLEQHHPDDKIAAFVLGLICLMGFSTILASGGFWSAIGWTM